LEVVVNYSTCKWSLHFNWLTGVYFLLYHCIVIALSIKEFSNDEKVVATDCLYTINLL